VRDDPNKPDPIITYYFQFTFSDGAKKIFTVNLQADTLAVIPPDLTESPPWTELSHCQCPNCPLDPAKYECCPIAVNLVDLIDFFKYSISFEQVHILITTKTRSYQKETALQEGVSALLGMYMVTSGCPIMDKLRPMLRAHIPFSTAQETTYRFLSMYLLAQYFLHRRNKKPDWDLVELKKLFLDIQTVNQYFWKRFISMKVEDASLNALVLLDNLAQYAAFSLDIDQFTETELLFKAYFD
jgi:hypothetical protein